MGLADVQLVLLALCSLRAWDAWLDFGPAGAAVWVAACAAPLAGRWGWVALAVVAFGSWAVADAQMSSNHVILVGWLAAAHALFTGEDRTRVIWWQTVVVYLFACLNKINAHYLSGAVVALSPFDVPLVPMSIAGVITEGLLAFMVWRRDPRAFPVAVVLHVGIIALMGANPMHTLMLVSFNGTLLCMVWLTTGGSRTRRPVRHASRQH